jgi:hypothetical protein
VSAHAQRLKIRLFVEGVEIPVIAVQVDARPNSPCVATIQIPPLAEGTRFLPRSLVHVFFLDFYATGNPHITGGGGNSDPGGPKNPSAYEQEVVAAEQVSPGAEANDLERQHYKLLFVGELVGFQWTKNANNRSLVLQCLDPSNYWDYAYQWNNTDIFGPGVKALFSGGSTNLFTDFLTDEGSEILALLRKGSRTYPKLKGLLSGIVSVLEGIGGTYFTPKAIGGQNVFFSLAELRLHITQMITAYEADPTSSNLMNASGYDGLFGRTLGGLGQQVSFRQAINALQGMIFHETFPQPCPLFIPGTYGTTTGQVMSNLNDVQGGALLLQWAKDLVKGQSLAMVELQDVADTNAAAESFTSADLKRSFTTGMETGAGVCTRALQEITTLRTPEFEKLRTHFTTGRSFLLQAKTELNKNWNGRFPMPVPIFKKVEDHLKHAQAAFQRVVDAQIPTTAAKDQVPARLNQQIFRPDVWFSAPPRCNVLFPDQYTSMTYSRAFLAEPTRFLLKTNDEFFGEDELFDNFFFAPKSPVANTKKNDPVLQALLSNGVMDHELFTGILPIFEKMGELNIFAAQSGIDNGKKLKVGLAQRSTNFLYFKHRFGARQMSIQARFNPYIAVGFPGLILDRYVDVDTLERHNQLLAQIGQNTRQTRNLLGTHFLGNFTEVSHNISQNGGTTSINVGYARQYEESVEFLGAVEKDQVVQQKIAGDATRLTTVAGLNPPPPGSVGPAGGLVIDSIEVTDGFSGSEETFPLYAGPRKKPGLKDVKVRVGLTLQAQDYGEAVAAWVGNPATPVRFRAFEVTEEVPRYRTQVVETPAEEYIRPGWYGPIWKPGNIGKVYDQFFRTGAITDETNITDPQGSHLSDPGGEEDQVGLRGLSSIVTQLDPQASIAQAVDFLILTYSYIRQADANADDFIKAYTWRPIASMVDMFGTNDLTLTADGARVLQGFEGFHSRAFGQYEDLFGLVTSDIESVLGIKRGEAASQKTDTRKRKQDAVLDYVAALQLSRAILG